MKRHEFFPVGLLAILIPLASCSGGLDPDGEIEKTDGVSADFLVDAGNVGKVIDVRDIFKKGYVATEAQITFADHPDFNSTLDIDLVTNLAILMIHNDSLTENEEAAFEAGVVANITISDQDQSVLTSYDDNQLELDDSNFPLRLTTAMPYLKGSLDMKEGVPYLLQSENSSGFITSFCSDCYVDSVYVVDNGAQQFYFTPVQGEADTYVIEHLGYAEGTLWYEDRGNGWLNLGGGPCCPLPPGGASEFVLEQDDDGWVKIRINNTNDYLIQVGNEMRWDGTGARFRLISDNIDWLVVDRGTVFNQPIMPPAMLDFAYSATLRNCSPATLEETVGKSDSRTRTTEVGTTESLQLFSSETLSFGIKVGFEVTAKVGVDVEGVGEAGEEVSVSEEVSFSEEYTTSQTTGSENTWSESTSTTTEVSRTRTLTVPPFTAVEVYDAIKSIENVRVPFTQVLRITASNKKDGTALSGPEIASQMLFNFVGGVVTTVGNDFMDMTIRGQADIDQVFEATTDVNELVGACN